MYKFKLELDHLYIDHMLDWNKTVMTLSSAFIGILLIGSKNENIQPYAWLSLFFILSIISFLTSQLGLIMHKKNKESERLPYHASFFWILGWVLFLWPMFAISLGLSKL